MSDKKTVYVDVDEEITGIIDKVRTAHEPIVALVLPKRAAVFQSIVNMKLLKRAAKQEDKKLVLITSEPTILPLAGTVGIHVAPNLTSQPYLPKTPGEPEIPVNIDPEVENPIQLDPATPIGEVADPSTLAPDQQSIEIDNRPKTPEGSDPIKDTDLPDKKAKKGTGGKLKVPNFQKFRKLFIIGGILLFLLLILAWWALFIAPKATVTLRGQTNDADLAFDIIADTSATELNEEGAIVPARTKELKKTETEKVPATGQKDTGNKATGTMTMKNCSQNDGPVVVLAGSGLSSGDLTFITSANVTLEPSVFSGGGTCLSATKDVAVTAQQPGDKYNVSARSYAASGAPGIIANGSAMSGGTSVMVKVVSAGDVESAKQKLTAKQTVVAEELKKNLKSEGYIGLSETLAAVAPKYSSSPAVGSEANEVTVTVDSTFTMLGLKEEDLRKIVKKQADKEESIDTEKQVILSDGLGNATFQVGAKQASKVNINIQTKVVAGPEIDQEAIKKEIFGKKRGEAEQILSARPGIKQVRVETKPFWNYSIPKKSSKINLVIEEADGQKITD